jgi:hypothetical protein
MLCGREPQQRIDLEGIGAAECVDFGRIEERDPSISALRAS